MAKAKNTTTTAPAAEVPSGRRSRSLDPHVETPKPTKNVENLARFVYTPDSGFHCGTATEWVARPSEQWAALTRTPKLGSFLTTNPMTVVFAQLTPGQKCEVAITEISMGGSFLSAKMARGILPFLPWHGDEEAANARPVVNPDEEGKTVPKNRKTTKAPATAAV